MSPARIVPFPVSRAAPATPRGRPATIVILPIVRIERFTAPERPRRRARRKQ